tara:strand:- start:378 stop:701 length:324 start_codon:yes stop_codon:yes gene_type:complete
MKLIEKNLRIDSNNNTAMLEEITNGITKEVNFSWSFGRYNALDNEVEVDVKFTDATEYDNIFNKQLSLSDTDVLEITNFVQEHIENNAIDYGLQEMFAEQFEYFEEY